MATELEIEALQEWLTRGRLYVASEEQNEIVLRRPAHNADFAPGGPAVGDALRSTLLAATQTAAKASQLQQRVISLEEAFGPRTDDAGKVWNALAATEHAVLRVNRDALAAQVHELESQIEEQRRRADTAEAALQALAKEVTNG